jgi:hypothetical protein
MAVLRGDGARLSGKKAQEDEARLLVYGGLDQTAAARLS